MVGCFGRSIRGNAGGIISLVAFEYKHHKALEADLMRCGYELKDVGRTLSWGALQSFIENLGVDSAVARETDPELYEWSTRVKTNMILADICDKLSMINANLVAVGSHKATKTPKPYPRPNKKPGTKYGADPVTVPELRQLFAGKRHKHG